MAQKSEIERSLICGVCKELFCRPKTLACQHSYCELCIKSVSQITQEGATTEGPVFPPLYIPAIDRVITKCPTCRRSMLIPAEINSALADLCSAVGGKCYEQRVTEADHQIAGTVLTKQHLRTLRESANQIFFAQLASQASLDASNQDGVLESPSTIPPHNWGGTPERYLSMTRPRGGVQMLFVAAMLVLLTLWYWYFQRNEVPFLTVITTIFVATLALQVWETWRKSARLGRYWEPAF